MSAGKSENGIKRIYPFVREVPVNPTLPTSRSNYFGVAWMAAARSLYKLFTSDCRLFTSDSRALSLLLVVVLKVFNVLIDAVFVAV